MNLDVQRYIRRLRKDLDFAAIGLFALKSRSIHVEDFTGKWDAKILEQLFRAVGDISQIVMMRGIKFETLKWTTGKYVISSIHLPEIQSTVIILYHDSKTAAPELAKKICLEVLNQLSPKKSNV